MPPSLIVFSHLRWDFVFQRPQHLMQRLARQCRVFFVEEPESGSGPPEMKVRKIASNLYVCRPQTGARSAGFCDEQLPELGRQLQLLVRDFRAPAHGAWFYTPMALPLLDVLHPSVVVYDCMDELSAFRGAPPQMIERERALFDRADVVFTGGPSLYAAKRHQHPNVHCFPSSVDVGHFSQAAQGSIAHPAQRHIPHPRLGFCGVIDERMDLGLLSAVAQSRPQWQLVLVGPCAKIDPDLLPRFANIHYLGQRSYEELPALMAGWDVCLQPFALNDATRFISPTKTLEYMAAGKPIVSTPIRDVADCYAGIVAIADGEDEFVQACEAALHEAPEAASRRRDAMRQAVDRSSWDETADAMRRLVDQAAWVRHRRRMLPPPASVCPTRKRVDPVAERKPKQASTIVIGAGPTGLSAGYHLGENSLVLEQNPTVGGWCRSIEDGGFTFDYAGHIMFSNDPYVHSLYRKLLGSNVHWQDREAWIYSKRTYTRYPFQGALYGLPPDVLKECLIGAIEARFGPLRAPSDTARESARPVCAVKSEALIDCCGDGTADLSSSQPRALSHNGHESFEDFIYRVWGAGVARHFALPYNRKLWAVPLNEMETSWLGGRVPLPDLEAMIEGALHPVPKPQGPNARFGYPLRGGFQALMNGFLPLLECDLETNARVVRIDPHARSVALSDGRTFGYRHLVSTAPLPALVRMLGGSVPACVADAAARLRHVSVRCVNLGIGRADVSDKHWVYYPEESVFHRIFLQGNASPYNNPPGGFGLTCEITYSPHKPLPCDGEALIDRCIRDCIDVGMLREDDRVLVRNQVDLPHAYVVYDHARKQSVETIRNWLLEYDIHLSGRYSEWEYYNSDHAFVAGRKVADAIRECDPTSIADNRTPLRHAAAQALSSRAGSRPSAPA
jgi:protoporphyrinogen oxidase/glycosyltransferase involved in cell wall biosynthesis